MSTAELFISGIAFLLASVLTFGMVVLYPAMVGRHLIVEMRRRELRDRLHWVIAQQRNGGHWVTRVPAREPYWEKLGGPLLSDWRPRLRWVSA